MKNLLAVSNRKKVLILLFVVFIFLRLFVDFPVFLFGSDNYKWLEAAKQFPYHKLYNNQVYLLHPPLYPYVIHIVDFFVSQDYTAAMLISFLSSIALFFILYKFFIMLTDNFNFTFMVLVFYTLSVPMILSSTQVLREPFVLILMVASLYYYVKGLKFNNRGSMIVSSLFGGLSGMTTDHTLFLFPAFVLSYIFFRNKKMNIIYAILPLAVTAMSYGSWILIKYYQYSKYEYYPNGPSGAPIRTDDLTLLSAAYPTLFKDYSASFAFLTGAVPTFKRVIFNLGYLFNLQPFPIPLGLNFSSMKYLLYPFHLAYMLLIYLPLALIVSYGIFHIILDFIKTRKIHNNCNLYILGIFGIFMMPLVQASIISPRYLYVAYLTFYYLLAFGLFLFLNKLGLYKKIDKILSIVMVCLLILVPFWILNNANFVFFNEVYPTAKNTADYINKNIDSEAVLMGFQGYEAKLIYLTNNDLVGSYPYPDKLDEVIDYYNVSYYIFGEYYSYGQEHRFNLDTIEYVKKHPEKFKLIATINEDYSSFYDELDPKRTDKVYIYKVVKT